MPRPKPDYDLAASLTEKLLGQIRISKAESGRRLGFSGNYACVKVSKALTGSEPSWPILHRLHDEVIGPALDVSSARPPAGAAEPEAR